ncbi:hypothetical protein BCR36DRAFT_347549 [Piromyces finnis]|uniref:protein-tyrosine-phosphatase n=1 Tax=Piromyces finnis TaxID=1754191 RepID=A0A1Y1VEW3_9FUNG|nr:hypothetical protein BCR36DRAFT_347549 [Piromyces finnis]|eukprot:ORX54655.1 hypothetical protein BCR36DRAFT_347549 [Piromyces finnis]
MEQLKFFSKKKILKSSQSFDDIEASKELFKKNKSKSSSRLYKDDQKKDQRYDIIATSVINDNDGQSDSDDSDKNIIEHEHELIKVKKLQKKENKQKSEPNLMSKKLDPTIVIDKSNIIESEKKDNHPVIQPDSNVNEVPVKSYLGSDSTGNITPNNLSFNKHYKNGSESNNNGRGFDNNGNNGRLMEDENNYKEDNKNLDERKGKENQVIIEEISVEKFFEYLNSSNISKVNESNLNNNGLFNILIFDFRVFNDFKNEYISNSINVNIPSLILNRSMKYQYTNSFNIQNFISTEDKTVVQQWILNNYRIDQNQNSNLNKKPLIIVYDDQNLMDIEICYSPVKTVMKFLEVQHIIALNELKYSSTSINDQSSCTDNSQSISSQENDLNNYLLNKQLNIAWVTGGFDAIYSHSESANYILNNESKEENIIISITQPDEAPCGTPLKLKPTLKLGFNDPSDMECSTPIDGKPSGFNNPIITITNNDDSSNKKQNLALNMLNKNKSSKQKLSLNIVCAISNNNDECKTPLSAIPNSKENIMGNPNCTLQPRLSIKKPNNLTISTPLTAGADDDFYPKNQRRKKSTLLISINNLEKKTDQPVPQMQPNGMLGLTNYPKNLYKSGVPEGKEIGNQPNSVQNMNYLHINGTNSFSPSSDLPLNISPTTSTVIPHYTRVLPYLYIGTETIPASSDAVERLKKLNVTHVLNVAMECNVGVTFPEDQIIYKKIDLADNLAENIARYLWESSEWIENERKKNNNAVFYIHCKAGKSRSATVVIAYLMKSEHWSLNKAYSYLKELRPNISPNLGFMSALLEMESEIKKQDEQIDTN